MDSTLPYENRFLNLVAGVSVLNDCKLLSIDFPGQVINLSGPLEGVRACCSELELLSQYQSE